MTWTGDHRAAPAAPKTCTKCRETLPLSSFYARSLAAGGGYHAWCKTCHSGASKKRGAPRRHNNTGGRHCPLCMGQSWRVDGARCRCGLLYAPEPPVSIHAVAASRCFRGSFPEGM